MSLKREKNYRNLKILPAIRHENISDRTICRWDFSSHMGHLIKNHIGVNHKNESRGESSITDF